MFHRVVTADWTAWVPYATFLFTFTIFIMILVKSIRMKQSESEHMASMPLDLDETIPATNHSES